MAGPPPALLIALAGLGGRIAAEFERQVEQNELRESIACVAHIDIHDTGVRLTLTTSLQVSRTPPTAADDGLATAQVAGNA